MSCVVRSSRPAEPATRVDGQQHRSNQIITVDIVTVDIVTVDIVTVDIVTVDIVTVDIVTVCPVGLMSFS